VADQWEYVEAWVIGTHPIPLDIRYFTIGNNPRWEGDEVGDRRIELNEGMMYREGQVVVRHGDEDPFIISMEEFIADGYQWSEDYRVVVDS
jgi:hypothetical protein